MPSIDLTEVKTAIPGSEPGPGQTSDSPTDTGGKPADPPTVEMDDDGKPLPFNEHPKWKAARQAEKKLNELLEKNDLDSIDDLVDLVGRGKSIVGKGIDPESLDEIISKATEMDQVKEYWAQQREEKLRAEESPEETAERLAKENDELKKKLTGKNEVEAGKRALEKFEKAVKGFVETAIPGAPKEEREAMAFLMGVGHPFAEIDIVNEGQIKKMGREVIKRVEALKQKTIKDFVESKKELPKMTTSSAAAPQPGGIRTLKQARSAMMEQLKQIVNK